MKRFVLVLIVGSILAPSVALGGSGPPLADAGLDQDVEQGTTVLLDGTGSRDPDGRIDAYRWRIETPAGAETTPRDPTSGRTSFVADEAGRYAVTLQVTDDEGNTATDTLYVDVEEAERTPTPTPSTPTPSGPTSEPTPPTETAATPTATRDGRNPVIRGARIVTGDRPLTASYRIEADYPVESIRWIRDGDRHSSGRETTIRWRPGVHTLRAVVTYENGARRDATFSDGSTRVEADPRPDLSLSELTRRGRIAGDANASDAFGNLERVTVAVDAHELGEKRASRSRIDDRRSEALSAAFDWSGIEPQKNYTVTATAVDARGQERTVSRTVETIGKPRVISAEFVNGPVDSYHERIDRERYTAHHVMKIDLNGLSRSAISISTTPKKEEETIEIADRHVERKGEKLLVHTYWAGMKPSGLDGYQIKSTWAADDFRWQGTERSSFHVTPSPPEIRLEMRNDGARSVGASEESSGSNLVDFSEPIVVDASESFDPDGSDLRFGWQLGAKPISANNETARLGSWDDGRLVLKDGFGERSTQTWSPTEGFVPEVTSMDVEAGRRSGAVRNQKEPYSPDRTLRVAVRTQAVHFRRETATADVGAALRGAEGEIVEWRKVTDTGTLAPGDSPGGENSFYYEGVVEISAGALANGALRPELVVYNERRPQEIRDRTELPSVTTRSLSETRRANLAVADLRYAVRKTTETSVTVDSRDELRARRANGFTVDSTDTEVVGYAIERRVQTQEARYRERTKRFDFRGSRRTFLRHRPNWRVAGTETTRKRIQRRTTTWRDSRGSGFTGRTREVLTEPAEYATERQFAYTTWETSTREITSRQCLPNVGCYTTSYEKTVVTPVRRTYWATSRHSRSHTATGRERRQLVSPAEYTTEYEHERFYWDVEQTTEYVASTTERIQQARYEWRHYDTVSSQRAAWRMANDESDLRVGGTETERTWTMVRENHEIVVRPAYEDDFDVVETRATVYGNVVRYESAGPEQSTRKTVTDTFETEFVGDGVVSREEIRERIKSGGDK
jgi:hypothetical protein